MSANQPSDVNELAIRRYESRDRRAVIDLHYAALTAAGAHFDEGRWDDDIKDIESEYIRNSGEFLVGEYGGRIVAMGGLQRTDPETAKVRRMRTDPDFQKRGFGTTILKRLEDRAQELEITRLFLDTSIQLPQALDFYPRHGYRRTHEEGSGNEKLIYFEKLLRSPA